MMKIERLLFADDVNFIVEINGILTFIDKIDFKGEVPFSVFFKVAGKTVYTSTDDDMRFFWKC